MGTAIADIVSTSIIGHLAAQAGGLAQVLPQQIGAGQSMPAGNASDLLRISPAAAIIIMLLLAALTAYIIKASRAKKKAGKDALAMSSEIQNLKNELDKRRTDLHMSLELIRIREEEIMINSQILERQNEKISNENKNFTEQLNYAALIQRAALPSNSQFSEMFSGFFVIYRPSQIVSGDFYWLQHIGRLKMLVSADCTGHGVPGAFLSMLGICILNNIVADLRQEVSAGAMLDKMRADLKTMLHQDGKLGSNQDSIDLAMLVIDGSTLHYAGANRPLIIIRNGEIKTVKPDNMPIGIYVKEKEHFRDNIIDLEPNDMLYTYSDGVTDQYGTDESGERKKFSTKRLKSTLQDLSRLPMQIQKEKMEAIIDGWRGDNEQLDDEILIGINI